MVEYIDGVPVYEDEEDRKKRMRGEITPGNVMTLIKD